MCAFTGKMQKFAKSAGFSVFFAAIAGCSQIDRFHGFIPPAGEVASLNIGQTTKAEVVQLLGPPISERVLENDTIYYASSQFRYFGPFAPEEIDRQVLAIEFNANDTLRNVSRYTLEDGRVVVLDRRVTDDGIEDVSYLSQLLGSFGRIDAGQLLGEP